MLSSCQPFELEFFLTAPIGFEPITQRLTAACSTVELQGKILKMPEQDLNLQHSDPKSDVLPLNYRATKSQWQDLHPRHSYYKYDTLLTELHWHLTLDII